MSRYIDKETIIGDTKKTLSNIVEEIKNKSAIVVYLSKDQEIQTQTAPFINVNTVETLMGSDLELSGNAVLCKRRGIIEVCGALEVGNLVNGGNVQPRIYKNKSNLVSSLLTRVANTADQTFFIPTKILSVEANTSLNLYLGNWSVNNLTAYSRNKATYLSVKYID